MTHSPLYSTVSYFFIIKIVKSSKWSLHANVFYYVATSNRYIIFTTISKKNLFSIFAASNIDHDPIVLQPNILWYEFFQKQITQKPMSHKFTNAHVLLWQRNKNVCNLKCNLWLINLKEVNKLSMTNKQQSFQS